MGGAVELAWFLWDPLAAGGSKSNSDVHLLVAADPVRPFHLVTEQLLQVDQTLLVPLQLT